MTAKRGVGGPVGYSFVEVIAEAYRVERFVDAHIAFDPKQRGAPTRAVECAEVELKMSIPAIWRALRAAKTYRKLARRAQGSPRMMELLSQARRSRRK